MTTTARPEPTSIGVVVSYGVSPTWKTIPQAPAPTEQALLKVTVGQPGNEVEFAISRRDAINFARYLRDVAGVKEVLT